MTRRIASFRSSLVLSAAFVAAAALVPLSARAQSDTNDPRAHLKAGLYDAGVASKGLDLIAHVNKPDDFHPNDPGGLTYANSDLAFGGHYVYQGNFSGFQIWDVSNPAKPVLTNHVVCFTEQGDVSVYGHLLFVSAENTGSRLDCGTQGIQDSVSKERMIGVRIFDISNPKAPKQVADVETCRGSHTHTLVQDPNDKGVIYVYVSGLARVRSTSEMAGCEGGDITDPNTALFRIEVIRVPLAHPEQAKIVSSPRIFNDLTAPPTHGVAVADTANGAAVKAAKRFLGRLGMPATASAADSDKAARLVADVMNFRNDTVKTKAAIDSLKAMGLNLRIPGGGARGGPSQCHDITVYPSAHYAAGACSGYGLLLNITDPTHPVRLQAVADSNFSFWHSATFANDASKLLFTDEWGGGTQPKCRATDPIDSTKLVLGGYWAGYYYNGYIYGSEIARGLDVFKLTPTADLTQNEIDAAKLVHFDLLNPQDQPKIVWPAAFPVALAYVDQLKRDNGLPADRLTSIENALEAARSSSGAKRAATLKKLGAVLTHDAQSASDTKRVKLLEGVVKGLEK